MLFYPHNQPGTHDPDSSDRGDGAVAVGAG